MAAKKSNVKRRKSGFALSEFAVQVIEAGDLITKLARKIVKIFVGGRKQ